MRAPHRPVSLDLFGQIAVSQADLELWVRVVVRLDPGSWRIAWYVRAYDVAGKIQAAKAAGQWPPQSKE